MLKDSCPEGEKTKLRLLTIGASATTLLQAQQAYADVIAPGSTFSVTATNFPAGNATATVTGGGAPVSIAGATIGTTTLITNGGNGEWISIDVATTATVGLAQNTGANWQFTIDGLTMTAPALLARRTIKLKNAVQRQRILHYEYLIKINALI